MNNDSEADKPADVDPATDLSTDATPRRKVTNQPKRLGWLGKSLNPFRIATLRGLGVVLPPLLTIIFFFWAWNTIERAVLKPVEAMARYAIFWATEDIVDDTEVRAELSSDSKSRILDSESGDVFMRADGRSYTQIGTKWIPLEVNDFVSRNPTDPPATTADGYYHQFVQQRFLKRHLIIPAFLALFIAFLYLTGKLLAAGIGRIFWRAIESLINRVPIIRNVYSSVKQVTDFVFNDSEQEEVQFRRVVAIEYPRKGIWSIGFVTGESLQDIRDVAGEPMLSVLMPTSPMPATGFTISIPKSETIDLDITIDQAIQFCVSCGVVVPNHQQDDATIDGEVRNRFRQIAQG